MDKVLNDIVGRFVYKRIRLKDDPLRKPNKYYIIYFRPDTNCYHIAINELYAAWKQYHKENLLTEFDVKDRLINHFGWSYDRGKQGIELKQIKNEYKDMLNEYNGDASIH